MPKFLNTDDEDWQKCTKKREEFIKLLLTEAERARGSRPICGWPRPPDHADRGLSKRRWENQVMHFRWQLEQFAQ